MGFRTKLLIECLDNRIVPSTVPMSPQSTSEVPAVVAPASQAAVSSHAVIGTVTMDWTNGSGDYSGCVDTAGLLSFGVDYTYVVNGVQVQGVHIITVNPDGSYSGHFNLPNGATQGNCSIQIVAIYDNPGGEPIRVVAQAP